MIPNLGSPLSPCLFPLSLSFSLTLPLSISPFSLPPLISLTGPLSKALVFFCRSRPFIQSRPNQTLDMAIMWFQVCWGGGKNKLVYVCGGAVPIPQKKLIRKDSLDNVEKWRYATEEEKWLEEYERATAVQVGLGETSSSAKGFSGALLEF
ncbi:uncharacterized protein LOC108992645 isoform X2 [Juglans regia]|uniref:Uncharacterized protein LOC108992645 isoform X2 n=1 Tax=Juglans regia TaxID=51240 RepID=A0A6P9ET32_JUGRE|nr:uncharacterized protein LOC108992645 isoform X2 [Juglans regia]